MEPFSNFHSENNETASSKRKVLSTATAADKKLRADLRFRLINEKPNDTALNWEKFRYIEFWHEHNLKSGTRVSHEIPHFA